jgi:hypothetical protein
LQNPANHSFIYNHNITFNFRKLFFFGGEIFSAKIANCCKKSYMLCSIKLPLKCINSIMGRNYPEKCQKHLL